MVDAVTITSGRAEMAYAASGGLPWHGLGQSLPPGQSIEERTQAAGMAWAIRRSKVRYVTSADEATPVRTWADKHVLFRSDTSAPLGLVSPDYKIVQPSAVMEFFRDLTASAGMELETAGTLFGGKRFWALARVGLPQSVGPNGQDPVGQYLCLATSADGSMATTAMYTTIRVVCNNTLTAALGSAKTSARVTHKSRFIADVVKDSMDLHVTEAQEQFSSTMDLFRALGQCTITKAEGEEALLDIMHPGNAELSPADRSKLTYGKSMSMLRALASGSGLIGPGVGTAWGLTNALTQWVDHTGTARTPDAKLDSALWGQGASLKTRGLSLIAERFLGWIPAASPQGGSYVTAGAELSLAELGL